MKSRGSKRAFCAWCATGHHVYCPGDCDCLTQGHEPDDALAARMGIYRRPDLKDAHPDVLATVWREGVTV